MSRPPHGHGSFYAHRPPGLVDVLNSPAYGFLFSGYRRFEPSNGGGFGGGGRGGDGVGVGGERFGVGELDGELGEVLEFVSGDGDGGGDGGDGGVGGSVVESDLLSA